MPLLGNCPTLGTTDIDHYTSRNESVTILTLLLYLSVCSQVTFNFKCLKLLLLHIRNKIVKKWCRHFQKTYNINFLSIIISPFLKKNKGKFLHQTNTTTLRIFPEIFFSNINSDDKLSPINFLRATKNYRGEHFFKPLPWKYWNGTFFIMTEQKR